MKTATGDNFEFAMLLVNDVYFQLEMCVEADKLQGCCRGKVGLEKSELVFD